MESLSSDQIKICIIKVQDRSFGETNKKNFRCRICDKEDAMENEMQKQENKNSEVTKQMETIEAMMREQLKHQGEGIVQLAGVLSRKQEERRRNKTC